MIGILEREKIGEGSYEGGNLSFFVHFPFFKICHHLTHPGWATNYEDTEWIIIHLISLSST